jgi:hypothetical protein
MDIIAILYKTHVQQTLLPNPPFTFCMDIKQKTFNEQLLNELYAKQAVFDAFVESCKEEFLKLGLPHGSVHHDPKIWVQVAVRAIKQNKSAETIVFPNGCCTLSYCSINQMYEIVANKLQK